jgi:glycosyltransferase involved in cell wall biosynthesis
MKILIPVATFEAAGGFRVLSELANYWIAAGHAVDFLADERSKPPYFPTVARILHYGSGGVIGNGNGSTQAFGTSGNARSIYSRMFKALNRVGRDYDVILANHSFTALPVALARTGNARKWYYIQAYEPEYYSFTPGWRGHLLQGLSALSYKLPLSQVANAPIYIGYRGIKAEKWIPPGLDLTIFRRREQMPTFRADAPVVLGTIGRHEQTKGTPDVLAAFEQLAERHSNIRLKVAFGNLPKGWAHPRAEIVVPCNDSELAAYYRSVDILVAVGTVQHGACHYPVLEAMASGTPVITTGYLPADESNAWLVPVHAPAAIAAAVERIVDTSPDELRARVDHASAAIQRFGWTQVAADFSALMTLPEAGQYAARS